MARKKKEDKVIEEETLNETVEETIEDQDDVEENINDTEDLVPTIASIDLADGEDTTVTSYVRKTPFGTEVWDPITKRTTLIDG